MKKLPLAKYFTLIEIVCAIVILSFSLTSLVVIVNQNMIKVYTSSAAIKCVQAAENKLNGYRAMPWAEIPASESGALVPSDTEAYQYEMTSVMQSNEYGNFVHITLTVTFPAVRTEKKNGFVLVTDIALPTSDTKAIEEEMRIRSLN